MTGMTTSSEGGPAAQCRTKRAAPPAAEGGQHNYQQASMNARRHYVQQERRQQDRRQVLGRSKNPRQRFHVVRVGPARMVPPLLAVSPRHSDVRNRGDTGHKHGDRKTGECPHLALTMAAIMVRASPRGAPSADPRAPSDRPSQAGIRVPSFPLRPTAVRIVRDRTVLRY